MESREYNWLMSCRLCTVNDDTDNHINLLNNRGLIEIIEKHFFVKILQDDSLPKVLCTSCHEFIMDVSRFYDRVITAQETLYKVFESTLDESQKSLNETNKMTEDSLLSHEMEFDFESTSGDITVEQNKEIEVLFQNCEINETCENKNESMLKRNMQQETDPVILDKILKEDLYLNPYNMIIRIDLKVKINCRHCNEEFQYLFSYMDHSATKHPSIGFDDIFLCPLCEKLHSTLRKFKLHLITHHMPDIPIPMKCEMCKVELESFLYYWEHINFKHSINVAKTNNEKDKMNNIRNNYWKCPFCTKHFTNYSPFKYHIGLTHIYWTKMYGGSYSVTMVDRVNASLLKKCPEVGWVSQIIGMEDNIESSDNQRKKISSIPSIYENTEITEMGCINERTGTNLQSYTKNMSPRCNNPKCLVGANTVANHKYKMHINFEMNINCKNCDEQFDRISPYVQHLTTFHSDLDSIEKWRCPMCRKLYFTSGDLKKHFLGCHIQDIYIALTCQRCCKTFQSVTLFGEHLQKVHSNQWSCPICHGNLVDKTKLKSHIGLMHIEWLCKECDADYSIDDLSINIICLECSETFATFFTYRNHMKVQHMNIIQTKKWLCPVCKKDSKLNSYYLKSHLKSVHAEFCINNMNNNDENNTKQNKNGISEFAEIVANQEKKILYHTKRIKLNSKIENSSLNIKEHYDNTLKNSNNHLLNKVLNTYGCNEKNINNVNPLNKPLEVEKGSCPDERVNRDMAESRRKKNDDVNLLKRNTTSPLCNGIIKEVIDFQLPLNCQRCNKRMECTAQFMEHTYREHSNLKLEDRWHCPICDVKPRRKSKFKLHMLHNHIHDIPMTLPCDQCNTKYDSFNKYLEHIYCEHKNKNDRDWKCPLCNRIMRYVSQLKSHLGTFHVLWLSQTIEMTTCDISDVKVFKCGLCKETQDNYDAFCHHLKMRHFMSVLKPNQSSQSQCTGRSDLEMNSQNRLKNDARAKKAIKANIRSKLKEKMMRLRREERNASAEMLLTCQYCKQTLKTFVQYRDHIKLYHINYAFRNNWACPICGIIKQYSSHLLHHLKQHFNSDSNDKYNKIDIVNNLTNKEVIESGNHNDENDSMSSSMLDSSTNIEVFEDQVEDFVRNHNYSNVSDKTNILTIDPSTASRIEVVNESNMQFYNDNCNDDILIDLNNSSTSIEIFKEQTKIIAPNDDGNGNYDNVNNMDINQTITIVSISFICQICKETFQSNDLLQIHMKDHEENKFSNNNNMIENVDDIEIHLQCKKCDFQSETFSEYCCHMKADHRGNTGRSLWSCPLCEECKLDKYKLKSHLIHHKELSKEINMSFTCKECNEELASYLKYSKHMEIKHDKGQLHDKWECPICNKIITKLRFRRHFMSHLPPEAKDVYKCPICKITFLIESALQQHIKKHKFERKVGNKKTACPYCGKFYLYRNLESHLKLKHIRKKKIKQKSRSFMCEECGQSVSSKYILNSHKERHAGIATHECEICTKRFTNIRQLKRHLETHENRKYMCTICGTQLSTRAVLNTHLWLHRIKKTQKCDKCDRAFKTRSELKKHMETHSGLKKTRRRKSPLTLVKLIAQEYQKDIHLQEVETESAEVTLKES